MRPRSILSLLLAFAAAGCSANVVPTSPSAPASTSPSATARASEVGSAEPSADSSSGEVIVTFRTAGDEEFRILLTDADDVRMASRLLTGEEEGLFPNGLIVRGDDAGVNAGYSWHIDPASVEFAQVATEVCDGRPSDVEAGTITGDYFCPWSAVVVAIEPAG